MSAIDEKPFNVIGKPVQRLDSLGHVTGRTQFFEDVNPAGMLHLKMHRSERHHANIVSVDTSAAEAVKGVVKILTHEDVPKNWYTVLTLINVGYPEELVLAEKKVLWYGEPIVAVVATSERAAREGAAAVKVDYEDLEPIFDVEEAIKADAYPLKPHGTNYFEYEGHHCRRVRLGDVEKGFAEADHIFEFKYQSKPIEQAPTETTGCIVEPKPDGRLKIYSNTQAAFFTLDNTALILDVPFGKLQLVGGTVGGGFGGKVDVTVEPITCIAAMKTGKPVKYVYDRYEEMQVSSPRAAERIYIKDGVIQRRDDRRPSGHALRGRRRVQPPQPVRDHQGRRAHARPVQHPERAHRLVVRVHQPHAVLGHARLRRDDRGLRAGDHDGPDRARAEPGPAAVPAQERLPRRGHEGPPQGRGGHGDHRGHPEGGRAGRPRAARRVPGAVVEGRSLDGQAARTGLRRRQLPHGHEPRR